MAVCREDCGPMPLFFTTDKVVYYMKSRMPTAVGSFDAWRDVCANWRFSAKTPFKTVLS